MTKDEARDAAWAWMDSRVDGTLGSNHDYFDNGFDAGYDFAKSEDRAVIDGFLQEVACAYRLRDAGPDKSGYTDSGPDYYDMVQAVYAEMFGKEGE